jgi:hypothetical protein
LKPVEPKEMFWSPTGSWEIGREAVFITSTLSDTWTRVYTGGKKNDKHE